MALISVIGILVVIGLVMWLINTYIPMQEGIKKIMNIAVIILVIFWLLKVFGLISYLTSIKV